MKRFLTLIVFAVVIVTLASCHKTDNKKISLPVNESEKVAVQDDEKGMQESHQLPTVLDPMNMEIGEYGKVGNTYVGLAYAKRGAHTTMALGVEEDITPGYEVLFAFFELYNDSNDISRDYTRGDITCYCDSIQVSAVESNFMFAEDGVEEYNSYELDGNTQAFAIVNFEVPKNWEEISLFCGSELAWRITSDEISDAPFDYKSIFNVNNKYETTNIGDAIYSGDYNIVFDGVQEYLPDDSFSDQNYVIYKFTVINTSPSALDYSLVGYNMRGYQNNYLLNGASYTVNDKIDGYINIFDVDTIQAGMTCKLYIAFEISEVSGTHCMVYDVGYISNEVLGSVFLEKI